MIKAYIDCNILLDWLLDREPFSLCSAKIIALIETGKIVGLVSPLTLANTYYIISKEINKRIADEFVRDSLRIFSVPGVSLKNIEEAIEFKKVILELSKQGKTQKEISKILNKNQSTVSRIIKNKIWTEI